MSMSHHQKIPHWKPEQQCVHSETQSLEAAQVSQALEETSPSSHPPVPGNLEALAAGTPQSTQKAISSCKLDKSNDSQEREASSASSKCLPDTENLPVGTLDEKVTLLVQFLLHKYQMNEPITKADMINVVIKEYRGDFPEIFKRASEHMELVFGIDVEEVDTTSHSYVLVNKLGLTYDPRLSGDGTMPKTSLLIIVLGVIFMKGNRATEEEIWEVLNMMGFYSGRNHFIFGEPRKFITKDLVQEKYLEYRQVPNSHPPRYEFLWGPRAHAETSKMKLLEFLTKIHESDPRCFSSQYQEALRDEAERAHVRAAARSSTTAKDRASSSAKSSSYPHP